MGEEEEKYDECRKREAKRASRECVSVFAMKMNGGTGLSFGGSESHVERQAHRQAVKERPGKRGERVKVEFYSQGKGEGKEAGKEDERVKRITESVGERDAHTESLTLPPDTRRARKRMRMREESEGEKTARKRERKEGAKEETEMADKLFNNNDGHKTWNAWQTTTSLIETHRSSQSDTCLCIAFTYPEGRQQQQLSHSVCLLESWTREERDLKGRKKGNGLKDERTSERIDARERETRHDCESRVWGSIAHLVLRVPCHKPVPDSRSLCHTSCPWTS